LLRDFFVCSFKTMKTKEKPLFMLAVKSFGEKDYRPGCFALLAILTTIVTVSFYLPIFWIAVPVVAVIALSTYNHTRLHLYCSHVEIKHLFRKRRRYYEEILSCKVELSENIDLGYDIYLRFYKHKKPMIVVCTHNYYFEDFLDLLYHKEVPLVISHKIGMVEMQNHDFRIITRTQRTSKENERAARVRKCWEKGSSAN